MSIDSDTKFTKAMIDAMTLAETARNLLNMGLSIEQVAIGTGLSIEQVTEIQTQLDSDSE